MAAINAQQIRKIYAIGNALGIVERGNEDDDLHALVSALTGKDSVKALTYTCLLYTSPSPRDRTRSRMPSSA